MRYLFRFFVAAPPIAPLMVSTFAAIVAVAAAVLVFDPARGAAVVMPAIVLQLFASSSGVAVPARRGHYDLLLTRAEGRARLALAHWVVSSAPGAASWAAIGLIEMAATGGSRSAAFSSGTCAALVVVSTLPWAMGVGLPRFAPGIGWVLVIVTVASLAPAGSVDVWLHEAAAAPASYTAAAVFLLYPPSAVGRALSADGWFLVAPALAVSALGMIVACRWIVRADFPLEAAQ